MLSFREQLTNYYLGDIVDEEKTEKSVAKKSLNANNSNNRYSLHEFNWTTSPVNYSL